MCAAAVTVVSPSCRSASAAAWRVVLQVAVEWLRRAVRVSTPKGRRSAKEGAVGLKEEQGRK